MNERIKELAEQAGYDIAYYPPDKHYPNGAYRGEGFELYLLLEFANAIIRECAMIVEGCERSDEVADGEYEDYEAATMIKEHFGVE